MKGKVKSRQEEILAGLSKEERDKVRELAMFYLKDKRDFLEHSVADAWIEASIHMLIKKGLLK